jgi:hypothetical protein
MWRSRRPEEIKFGRGKSKSKQKTREAICGGDPWKPSVESCANSKSKEKTCCPGAVLQNWITVLQELQVTAAFGKRGKCHGERGKRIRERDTRTVCEKTEQFFFCKFYTISTSMNCLGRNTSNCLDLF